MEQREELIKQILMQINQPLWSHWTIKERIGVGSFSEVYRMEAKLNGEKVDSALKIEPLVANRIVYSKKDKEQYIEKAVKLAKNEINIMHQLKDCQNIVRYEEEQREAFYYHGQFEGYYQLIRMELLLCIDDLLNKRKFELSESNIRRLALEIGNGISAVHKKGIMHRDIKPSNLFLSKKKVYKLGDFNISKQSETANTIAGTDEYMAPEIYYKTENSERRYTKQTDIYSFGITLYYLMNDLRFPFEDDTLDLEQVLLKRMSGAVFPLPRNASKEFGEIIQKACAYKTEDRFQTVDEMIEAIRKLPETEDIFIDRSKKIQKKRYKAKGKEREEIQKNEIKENIKAVNKRTWFIKGLLLAIAITIIIVPFKNNFSKISESFLFKQILKRERINDIETKAEIEIKTEVNTRNDNLKEIEQKEEQNIFLEPEIINNKNDFIIEDGVLKKYTGNEKDIVILDEVTEIGEKAFKHNNNLESITMPNTVKSIGFSAFAWCENLESVQMSDNINVIEKNAFRGCKKLKSIVIPKNVKKIKMRTFQECKSLELVKFSEGVEIIGCLAFDRCKNLKEIELPNSMKKVDTWAFSNCKNLEKVIVSNKETKFLWESLEKKTDKLTIYCPYNSKAFLYAQQEEISCFINFYQER